MILLFLLILLIVIMLSFPAIITIKCAHKKIYCKHCNTLLIRWQRPNNGLYDYDCKIYGYSKGSGNFYDQYDQIKNYLEKVNEQRIKNNKKPLKRLSLSELNKAIDNSPNEAYFRIQRTTQDHPHNPEYNNRSKRTS